MVKKKSNQLSNLHRNRSRFRIALSVTLVVLIIASIGAFEYLTEPHSQIPLFELKPIPQGGDFGINTNITTFPTEFNVSSPNYSTVLEMLQAPPASVIAPGLSIENSLAVSHLNISVKSPYTAVTFYVQGAMLTIGNYSTQTYHFFYNGHGTAWGITFVIDGNTIGNYDATGQNYTATYNVTVVPVLHIGLFHFKQNPIVLSLTTEYLWFHIANTTV